MFGGLGGQEKRRPQQLIASFNIYITPGVFFAKKAGDEVVESEEFEGEGEITAITQEGHFKDPQKIYKGNVIDPLGVREIVPHLPEKTANKSAQPQSIHWTPIAFGNVKGQGAVSQPNVDGFKDEVHGQPDEGEKVPRPDGKQEKHNQTGE